MQQLNTILLTGGSAGIGLATARLLMQGGACVYAASRRGGVEEHMANNNGRIIPIKMDVNNSVEIDVVINKIIEERGCIDAVICDAGNGIAGAIEDTSEEEAKYQFETNFFGVVRTVNACMPVFRQQGYGRIITISSVAGIVPIPYQSFYSAVKSAVLIFSKALSIEVKQYGIECCCILPGDTKTEFTKNRVFTTKSQRANSPYYEKMKRSIDKMVSDEQTGMEPERIGQAIVRQLQAKKMAMVYIPRFDYKFFAFLVRILPNRVVLKIVSWLYN